MVVQVTDTILEDTKDTRDHCLRRVNCVKTIQWSLMGSDKWLFSVECDPTNCRQGMCFKIRQHVF